MKTIDNFNFAGKKVLVRVDFNVPLDDQFKITDDTRIRAALPTIHKILNDKGAVILMSHLGRPKDGPSEKYSLKHLVTPLSALLQKPVQFANDCIGEQAMKAAIGLKAGEVLLLENLRFHKEEEKGDPDFAKKLSQLVNNDNKGNGFYVNDAFGTAHRAHASTAIIARFFPEAKCFGYVMSSELTNADRVIKNAVKPFTAILGGAKVSDKIVILEQLIGKADNIIIGGGMAFTFIRAQGGHIGSSLLENERLDNALKIIREAKEKGVKLFLPVDAVIADKFSNEASRKTVAADAIPEGWMGLDIGEASQKEFAGVIAASKTILWNGPMGVFEMDHFESGTKAVALALAEATKKGAYSLIGGGDSVAAINKFGLASSVSYVSTGGGALLEYFESGTLPGIEAINFS